MDYIIWFGKLAWFFLPAGIANMAPVLVQRHWKILAIPIYEPWLGSHKTWRGIIAGTIFGGLTFAAQRAFVESFPKLASVSAYDYKLFPWWFGLLLGFAALWGDAIKSFFKRSFRIAPGKPWFPFDQLDFLIGAFIITSVVVDIDLKTWLLMIFGGISLHIIVNRIAFRLKLKDTPW